MKNKTLIALLCVAICSLPVAAKIKVVEKSSKKVPEWVYDAGEGNIMVHVEAPTLGIAQEQAMEKIYERILESVARNVMSSESSSMSHKEVDGNLTESESYERAVKFRSANLPFLKGVSESNIKGTYWVKQLDTDTKRNSVSYYVLYPFSKTDALLLQNQFDKLEAEKAGELASLERGIDNITSVDQIKQAITQLESLEAYFFDDVRIKKVQGLKSRYRDLYKHLSLKVTEPSEGVYHLSAVLSGREVRLTTQPRTSSNCASRIEVNPSGNGFDITCDTADCLPEEENYIDILLRIDGNKYTTRINLK